MDRKLRAGEPSLGGYCQRSSYLLSSKSAGQVHTHPVMWAASCSPHDAGRDWRRLRERSALRCKRHEVRTSP